MKERRGCLGRRGRPGGRVDRRRRSGRASATAWRARWPRRGTRSSASRADRVPGRVAADGRLRRGLPGGARSPRRGRRAPGAARGVVAFVGSGVLASALAMDKPLARRLFELAGLPVARGITARRPAPGDDADARLAAAALHAAARAKREVGARIVVKPASQGSDSASRASKRGRGPGRGGLRDRRGVAPRRRRPARALREGPRGDVRRDRRRTGRPEAAPSDRDRVPERRLLLVRGALRARAQRPYLPRRAGRRSHARRPGPRRLRRKALGCRDSQPRGHHRRRRRRRGSAHPPRGEHAPRLHRDEPLPRGGRARRDPARSPLRHARLRGPRAVRPAASRLCRFPL